MIFYNLKNSVPSIYIVVLGLLHHMHLTFGQAHNCDLSDLVALTLLLIFNIGKLNFIGRAEMGINSHWKFTVCYFLPLLHILLSFTQIFAFTQSIFTILFFGYRK